VTNGLQHARLDRHFLHLGSHGAATAIVSVESSTGSLHAMILSDGLFAAKGHDDGRLIVSFSAELDDRRMEVVEERLVVPGGFR